MFKADPNNPITWWTYVVTLLIAICIYIILRKRKDIQSVIGFKNKSTTKKPTARIPIITTNNLNLLYSKSSIRRASTRIDNLIFQFNKKFLGNQPDFIIRSPGIVNLIGSHINYYGYNVLPMAIEKDILFAIKVNENTNNIIQLCNKQQKEYPSIQIDLSSKIETNIELAIKNNDWSKYFLAAFHGICNKFNNKFDIKKFKSLQIFVDGNIPIGSGLSSSCAFICGCVISLLFSNLSGKDFFALNKLKICKFCIKCEEYIGIDSIGMNKIICMSANKGYAKYISFIPELKSINIKLPSQLNVCWIISNCLIKNKFSNDIRMVECRLAAVLLAKLLKLRQWRQILTFKHIQQITKMKLDELLFKTMDLLNDNNYSIQQIEYELQCKQLGFTLEDLMVGLPKGKIIMNNLRKLNNKYKLALQKRTLHIYSEAHRVIEFKNICIEYFSDIQYDDEKINLNNNNNNNNISIGIKRLGKLMNNSYLSCRDKYECCCDELDELQSLSIDAGAFGSCLIGNKSNTCIISLIKKKIK
eukprot:385607_1